MSFSCQHFDQPRNYCNKLRKTCKLGQTGCVLHGKVVLAPGPEDPEKSKTKRKSGGRGC